jgi:uncharacterized protein YegP (UPF0339 family)
MAPEFEVYQGNDDQFYFRLRAANNEIVLTSEGYVSKDGCLNGVDSVKSNAPMVEHFQKKQSSDNQYYFLLVAANGKTIGSSEMYTTEAARDHGIEVVHDVAPQAHVEILAEIH